MVAPVITASLGTLGLLLGKLTGLLAGEYGRMRGVRGQILSLRSELSSMHAALQKYTMLEDPDVQVKQWISLVRELSYDTEDCIDKFILHLGNGGRHSGFKEFFRKTSRCLKTLGSRYGIADQIDELKVRIKQVKELRNSYKLDDTPSTFSHATVDPRLCAFFAEDAELVGMDGPRDDLAKWMVEKESSWSKHRRVLSIVGFGGLGKTALAKEVYRKIEGKFNYSATVSVSQKPNIKKIIKDMISKVPDGFTKDFDIWDEMTSIEKLRELLRHKRYLIIIDDIWSTQAWDAIKGAFPDDNCSSRIIVTTRIVDVARSCCRGGGNRMHEMEALSDLHSRRLFFKRIFDNEEACPDMLKEVSNEILKKCGGLPLAIISISALLANKPESKEEWEKVKRSIGSALENSPSLEGMNKILSLSYNDLPSNLKTCLLYLSIFPEDCVINRERLVRRWVAEGFISEERGLSQQEVAENNFYELINKSMIQPVDIGYDGKARACRVHDMMLELIISKSAEENFTTVVAGRKMDLENRHGFIRRLSIQDIDKELASVLESEDLSHVRSLTVTSYGCCRHLPSLVKFKALRVLDFHACWGLTEYYDMNGMEKLFQLKYLDLSDTRIPELPSGVVMLRSLETLDLRYTVITELPAGICQLNKMQHLLISSHYYHEKESLIVGIPDGIGNMRNLRVLWGFNIAKSSLNVVDQLGNLTNLNELHVALNHEGSNEYDRHKEMLLSSLCKLGRCKLQSFRIISWGCSLGYLDSWSPLPFSLQTFYMSSDHFFTNIPKWIVPALISLSFLDINLTELREEGLHTLGELPGLLLINIWLETGPKKRFTIQGFGFPRLKEFGAFTDDGAYITFVKGAMPKLEILKLKYCVSTAKTYDFYLGIEHLPCLKTVHAKLINGGATPSEREAAGAAIRIEAGAHPNHPAVIFESTRYF